MAASSSENHKTPRYFWPSVALVTLIGAIPRLWELGRASLWLDEIFTEIWMQASFIDSMELILENAIQTPFYFILVYVWPNGGEATLRMPSALMGIAGIPLLMFVIVRLYSRYDWALLAGAMLALNPYHIWLSRTARPYPLVFILSLLASYYFLVLLSGQRTRTNWIAFTAISMAAYVTHYYLLGLPLAQYIFFAFILRGQRGFFRRWFRAQIIAGIPLAFWVFALWQWGTVSVGISWIPVPSLADPFITFWNMIVGYDGSIRWFIVPGLAAAGVGFVVGLIRSARSLTINRNDFYWFWFVVAPFVAVFAISLFHPLYVDRYFMIMLPPLLILTIQGWDRLLRQRHIMIRVIPALLVIWASIGTILVTLDEGIDEKEDWRAVGAYIEAQRGPNDGLLVETPIELLSVWRYMDDEAMAYAWLLDGPPLDEQYETPVTRVWAVYRNPKEDGHRQGVLEDFDPFAESASPIDDWLRDHREAVIDDQTREFNGVTVLLVEVAIPSGAVN